MEIKTMFKNAGEPWYQEEDNQLNQLYNVELLNIMEISKIHNRAPGGIISRLCKHNYIPNRISARGYLEYQNSDMYKQIVLKNRENNIQFQKENVKKKENILITIDKNDYLELKADIEGMKNEITELKKTIQDFVEIMKEMYDFGDAKN